MTQLHNPSSLFRNDPKWLLDARQQAFADFAAAKLPDQDEERWRRSDVNDFDPNKLAQQPWLANGQVAGVLSQPLASGYEELSKNAYVLVIGGGQSRMIGIDLPESIGLRVAVGEAAAKIFPELITRHLARRSQDFGANVFADFHRAMTQNFVVVDVADNAQLDKPLALIFRGEGVAQVSTVLVNLGVGASLQLAEDYRASAPGGQILSRYQLAERAYLAAVTYFGGEATGNFLHQCDAELAGQANLQAAMIWRGGRKVRSLVRSSLLGKEARSELRGIVVGSGRQHFDIEPCQIHVAPHTSSDMLFKTVLTEKSRAIFQGDITMQRAAQHCEAYQLNKNLLLSAQARVDTLPKLSILPDDVKCKHGAATGSIDPQQLYYLQARGFSPAQAVKLILKGFFADVVAKLPEGYLQQAYAGILLDNAEDYASTADLGGI